ncbi:hypothetical protein [Companilactobacillus ginsenosidimutans]|uniref:DUF4352 domain-containing protein n=1 Tax=Companilactobacillus ginsenosidimutans TaxID=1007676 RepID=A0A0H4QKX4_9LACO|nr:hypothetical protein [Companilactobacillus ginsenosidimutans]AKP67751.1 hypothetical protein ABM34_09565 [Companilactobacillus ginsenosidimutans]
MKKLILILLSVSLLFITVGCANNNTNQSKQGNNTTSHESAYYEDLNKSDKKQILFKFKEYQDETKDNIADPVFIVSTKITNKSNKTIIFDQSKFIIYVTSQMKITSNKSGTLKIKPNETKTINQMFVDVPEQSLVGDGYIMYLNSTNKLDNVSSLKAPAIHGGENPSETTSDNSENTNQNVSSTDNAQSSSRQITSDEAVNIIKSQAGISSDAHMGVMSYPDGNLTDTASGRQAYWVRVKANDDMWGAKSDFTVYTDGTWKNGQPAEN